MYLEKAPKVEGYTFAELNHLEKVVKGGMHYEDMLKAIEEWNSKPFKEVVEKYDFFVFDNETPDDFKLRVLHYLNDEEGKELHLQYLSLSEETKQRILEVSEEINYEELAYWRKANHIHNWFVDNVQGGRDDCEPYEVTKEQLGALLQTCSSVMSDKDKARDLLPTASGFFFGGTEYDEYYFHDIEMTIKQIEKIFEAVDFTNNSVFYLASW